MSMRAKHETDEVDGEFREDGCEGCKVVLNEVTAPPTGLTVSMDFVKKVPEIDTRGRCVPDPFGGCTSSKGCTPIVKITVVNNSGAILDGQITQTTDQPSDYFTLSDGGVRTEVTYGFIDQSGGGVHSSGFGYACGTNHVNIKMLNQADPPVTVYEGNVACTACTGAGE